MSESPRYSSLQDYLRVLRDHRLVVVVCTLLFGGAALLYAGQQEEVYEAEASMSFTEITQEFSEIGAPAPAFQTAEQRSATYAQRITEADVAEAARRRLGTRTPIDQLLATIDTNVETRTYFVVITAEAGSPETAAAIANAFANAAESVFNREARQRFLDRAQTLRVQNRQLRRQRRSRGPIVDSTIAGNIDRINRLETIADAASPATVQIAAEPDPDPIRPTPVRNTVVGIIVGLTIGLIIAFMRAALDRRFRRIGEIRDELQLPLLGHVRDQVLGRSVIGEDKRRGRLDDEELESFRILRTNLDFLDVDTAMRTVLVTSALPEEGKSTVSGALAYAYAASGKRALLVECDLRRPTLSERFQLEARPGLTDYLAGHAEPVDILRTVSLTPPSMNGSGPTEANTFVVIPAGTRSGQPAEMLSSERFKHFLEEVRGAYDVVLLDTSPLLSVVDTLELVPLVDGVVLCVRASKTTRDQARAAKEALGHLPDRPIGVVVTGVKPGDSAEYGYYSYAYDAR